MSLRRVFICHTLYLLVPIYLSMNFSDLLVGLVNVLIDILGRFTIDWHWGNFGCKFIRYFQVSNAVLYAPITLRGGHIFIMLIKLFHFLRGNNTP